MQQIWSVDSQKIQIQILVDSSSHCICSQNTA